MGGYVLLPAAAAIGTELIAFARNPVVYFATNPASCIGAVDVAAGTAAGVPLTGVPVPHSVPNAGAAGKGGTKGAGIVADEGATASGKTIFVDSKGNALVGDWSSTKTLLAPENAAVHWAKHQGEFPEFTNASQYTNASQNFVTNPPPGVLTKNKPNGDVMFYDPKTNTFAVKTSAGAPRTMFKPVDGINYWNKQ